eukprot:TRINITY_DN55287_c0_g1_i1.p1 TRINITY_DN55287_c0_g1~~TRINITY_DN55287_c0_g1_i1.p1  ORF type:complete len:839 (+),score=145.80 TRINITY_DN55287_c0_g1_i1:51-2567(+)
MAAPSFRNRQHDAVTGALSVADAISSAVAGDAKLAPGCASRLQRAQIPRSAVLDDGTYVSANMAALRIRNSEREFMRRPSLGAAVEGHASSRKFNETHRLDFQDVLDDGFRVRFANEILIVDANKDPILRHFMTWLLDEVECEPGSPSDRVRCASMLVAEAFGGVPKANVKELLGHRVQALRTERGARAVDVPVGALLGGPGVKDVVGVRDGVGICRHRAILFKYVCDTLGLANCAVVSGVVVKKVGLCDVAELRESSSGPPDHMWNVVDVYQERFLVDLMLQPGELIRDEQKIAAMYHRLNGRAGIKSLAAFAEEDEEEHETSELEEDRDSAKKSVSNRFEVGEDRVGATMRNRSDASSSERQEISVLSFNCRSSLGSVMLGTDVRGKELTKADVDIAPFLNEVVAINDAACSQADVVCLQDGYWGQSSILGSAGFDLSVCSAAAGLSDRLHDAVYDDEMILDSFPKAMHRNRLCNQIYVSRRSTWEVVDTCAERISSDMPLPGFGGRAQGILASRSMVWVKLRRRGETFSRSVYVMCTQLSGGRLEDPYFLRQLAAERVEQSRRILEAYGSRPEPMDTDVAILAGGFNASHFHGAAADCCLLREHFQACAERFPGVWEDAEECGALVDTQRRQSTEKSARGGYASIVKEAEKAEELCLLERFADYMRAPLRVVRRCGWSHIATNNLPSPRDLVDFTDGLITSRQLPLVRALIAVPIVGERQASRLRSRAVKALSGRFLLEAAFDTGVIGGDANTKPMVTTGGHSIDKTSGSTREEKKIAELEVWSKTHNAWFQALDWSVRTSDGRIEVTFQVPGTGVCRKALQRTSKWLRPLPQGA